LISFSDGGGEPSTQPFHPFLAGGRFFLIRDSIGKRGNSSSSSGVRGLLEDVRDVLDEFEGPGVEYGDDGIGGGDGGVTDSDRSREHVANWIVGREA